MNQTLRIFVYGTLRKHDYNHDLLKESKMIYSQAWVNGTLYDTGLGYPALDIETGEVTYGEVYEITSDELSALDVLEGYEDGREENLFARRILPVFTDDSSLEAYVYIIDVSKKGLLKEKIPFGDWKVHLFLKRNQDNFFYFAFGSCMDDERYHVQGVGHLFKDQIGVGELENFHICFSRHASDGGKADIKEGYGKVEGIVYLLPKEALEYLFEREGVYGSIYRPIFLDITINDESVLTDVLTFTVINKEEDLTPPDHYALEILRGAKGEVSEMYYSYLKEYIANLGVDVESLEATIKSCNSKE
ncbi:MAG: gamma-glutamylcyclotransferase [Bacillus sp. (in: Bacteria)]|nr:gamma-glutamylcyclotransferase [Bacillus sp. (in: firmicutes)]